MAYQIKRAQKISEDVEFLSADGSEKLKVTLEVDIPRIARQYTVAMTAYNQILGLQARDKDNSEIAEKAGEAILKAFRVIFGEDNVQKILNFFEGEYVEMAQQMTPFLAEVITPEIARYFEDNYQKAASNYKGKKSMFRGRS